MASKLFKILDGIKSSDYAERILSNANGVNKANKDDFLRLVFVD